MAIRTSGFITPLPKTTKEETAKTKMLKIFAQEILSESIAFDKLESVTVDSIKETASKYFSFLVDVSALRTTETQVDFGLHYFIGEKRLTIDCVIKAPIALPNRLQVK